MENKTLNILLQNIRSMRKNFDSFNVYLETLSIKPMIVCLTETWLNDRFNHSLFTLNGYHNHKSAVGATSDSVISAKQVDDMISDDTWIKLEKQNFASKNW